MVGSTNGSEQTISIFTFSWNSATIVLPRYCSTTSRSPPWPVTRLKVMPVTPARNSAALTSGSRSGRMMVVIRRIALPLVHEVAKHDRPLPSGQRAVALPGSISVGRTPSSRGLLLREAVQCAESPHEIEGVNADDGVIGEQ